MSPVSMRGESIEVSLLPPSERAAVGEVWLELEAAAGSGLAASWTWTDTWLRHYGESVPHRFAICRDDDRPCAAALVTSSRRHKPCIPAIRVLHVGTAGEPSGGVYVEWNRLLALPGKREVAANALLARLQRERAWDELRLDGFDPLDAKSFLAGADRAIVRRERSPVTDLAAVRARGGDVLDVLGKGTRRRLRQSLSAFGELETEWAVEVDRALEILDELATLHSEAWLDRGERGAFTDPAFGAFHRDLIAQLLPSGRTVLFRIRRAAGTVGCLYCLTDGGRVLFYQSGLAPFEDNRLRAGLVSHLLCMRACAERGFDEYDFLAGEARYKDELSTGAREQVWAVVRRPRVRFAAVAGARAVRRLAGRGAPQ